MTSYCGNIEEYKKYLKGEKNDCQYEDPDTRREQSSVFYVNLVKFLAYQEIKMKNRLHREKWEYKFIGYKSEAYNYTDSPDSIRITYKDNSVEKKLFLRSDQFGFSAPLGEKGHHYSWSNKYPYAKYLNYNNENEVSCEFIADCIRSTRTIGGCFIWPIEYAGKWYTKYNLARGIRSYLEDRVDLTLLEVKHYYDDPESYKINNTYNDRLYSSIKSDTSKMEDFLSHFGSFENYVQYFHFQNFVEKINDNTLIPFNIVCSDFEKNNKVILENEQEHKTNLIKGLDEKSLEKMLKNIKILTSERTQWIENNIFKNQET